VPVLFGTHNLSATEGAPKVIRDVAVGLHAAGAVRATLFAPAPGPAAGGLPALADDTPFGRRFLDGKWTPTEYAAALRHLRAVLRRSGAEAVVANTVGLFPLVEAAIRAGRPSVLCVQETYPPGLRAALFSPYARWRLEWAMRHAGRVLFPSRDCRAAYADLGLGNAEVVPNGLDPAPIDAYLREAPRADPEAGLRPAGFRVVAVGTVCERKAQHVLVEAAAVLAGTRRDFAVHLVGGRAGLPYHGYVAGLIAARGLADVVDLVPETPDVWRYLRAADVYVCTSHVEGYSLSVLEGLAFGLPVVSTRCGGVAEQVSWGHNAIPVGFDDPAGLAAALGRLMADPPLLQRMRAEARAGFDALPDAAAVAAGYARVLAAAVRAARC
jgi:glycosyltransferase involved in cell wall biosynthesis